MGDLGQLPPNLFFDAPQYETVWAIHRRNQRLGKHGATAQYWMVYIDLVQLYLLFSRTNDLELYIHCLGRMCSIFFATSRPNYSRWMVRYHLNLLNIDITHPGIRETLKNGGLSVRRTEKTFLPKSSWFNLGTDGQCRCCLTSHWNGCLFRVNRGAQAVDGYQVYEKCDRWTITRASWHEKEGRCDTRVETLPCRKRQCRPTEDHKWHWSNT